MKIPRTVFTCGPFAMDSMTILLLNISFDDVLRLFLLSFEKLEDTRRQVALLFLYNKRFNSRYLTETPLIDKICLVSVLLSSLLSFTATETFRTLFTVIKILLFLNSTPSYLIRKNLDKTASRHLRG